MSRRRTVGNLVALVTLHASNATLPLIGFPLIMHRVGAAAFKTLVFTESLTLVVLTCVIFSFDIEGITDLVSLRGDGGPRPVDMLFSEILITRLVIFGGVSAGLIGVMTLVNPSIVLMTLGWLLVPLGYALQSNWFFQGIERNATLAFVSLCTRGLCLYLIYALIRSPADAMLVPGVIGGASLCGGLVALGLVVWRHEVRLRPVHWTTIRQRIRQGSKLFVGNLAVFLYRGVNVPIIGAVGSTDAVATYVIAEKWVRTLQAAVVPLNQLALPKVVRALRTTEGQGETAIRTLWRYTLPQEALLLIGLVALAGGIIIAYATGHDGVVTALPLAPIWLASGMAIVVLVGTANFMFGVAGFAALGMQTSFARATVLTGMVNVPLCLGLAATFGAVGAAACFVAAELILLAQLVYGLRWRDRRTSDGRAIGA